MQPQSIATLLLLFRGPYLLLGDKLTGEVGIGKLNGPGGKVVGEETLEECVVRETWEEVGIQVDPDGLEHVAYMDIYFGSELFQTVHTFTARRFTGEPQRTKDMQPYWFPVDHLPYSQMHEADQHWLPHIFIGGKFYAKVWYQEKGEKLLGIEMLRY